MIERLSLNQITVNRLTLRECVEACVRHKIPWIAPWRNRVEEIGVRESARILRDSGLRISSLCRGGFFPAATEAERVARIDDNRRAIDEAAELAAGCVVLVCGPAPDRDIDAARGMVADGIAAILPHARERGVRLGIEPLHPMFAADRSVIVTLDQALDLAERLNAPSVGVVIDAFHVWWDPRLYAGIQRATGKIVGFHVSDWAVPLPGIVTGRSMMGDGVIELRRIRSAVDAAGYDGPIEVEIMNEAIWARPEDSVLPEMIDRYLAMRSEGTIPRMRFFAAVWILIPSVLLAQLDPAAAERGRSQFKSSCGFCHGEDATGNRAPDLVRSVTVGHDVNGNLLAPLIRSGIPDTGMPGFSTLTSAQISDIAVFLHQRRAGCDQHESRAGGLSACEASYRECERGQGLLQRRGRLLGMPFSDGRSGRNRGQVSPARVATAVPVPWREGRQADGNRDAAGWLEGGRHGGARRRVRHRHHGPGGVVQSWDRSQVKVEMHDPLAAHRALMPKYTDADIHNLFAYLETLK